jgi:serine/threonine protein kinase
MQLSDGMKDQPSDPGQSAVRPPKPGVNLDPVELIARALEADQPPSVRREWVPPEPGELASMIPQYEIVRLLGRGGMGAVYKGRQPELDRPVAIKILPAEIAADEQFVERFRREARLLAKLHHPGIVTVYDSGKTHDGQLYFVMEYVDGTDLRSVIKNGGLAPEQALAATAQICEALRVAHEHGVVHRDIKPENVLLTRDGQIKLADFGLSRPSRDQERQKFTMTNMVMGSPDYMAPEQKSGEADQRSDIFALGVMLYEMLTGQVPRGAFEPPSRKIGIDIRIDEVVLRALQAEPDKRYQNVSEMKSDVETIYYTPTANYAEAPAPAKRAGSATKAGSRRSIILACSILAAAAGASAWLWKSGLLPMEKKPWMESARSSTPPPSGESAKLADPDSPLPAMVFIKNRLSGRFLHLDGQKSGDAFNYSYPIRWGQQDRSTFFPRAAGGGYYHLLHAYSGKHMYSPGSGEPSEIFLRGPVEPGHEDDYLFGFEQDGDSTWRIRHKSSGKYLVATSTAEGVAVQASKTIPQEMKSAGEFEIIAVADSGEGITAASSHDLPPLRRPESPATLQQRLDVATAAVWVNDDFSDANKSNFGYGEWKDAFKDGKIILQGRRGPIWGRDYFSDFLCRLVARTSNGKHRGWGLVFCKFLRPAVSSEGPVEGVEVHLDSEGMLTITPTRWMRPDQVRIKPLGPLKVPNFRPDDFNSLAVIFTNGSEIEVFVNDLQACETVTLPYKIDPARLQISSRGGASAPSRLELDSLEVISMVEKRE